MHQVGNAPLTILLTAQSLGAAIFFKPLHQCGHHPAALPQLVIRVVLFQCRFPRLFVVQQDIQLCGGQPLRFGRQRGTQSAFVRRMRHGL